MKLGLGSAFLAVMLAGLGCSFDDAADADARARAAAIDAAPTRCPVGFARALHKSTNVHSSKEVAVDSLPLPRSLTSKIVCAIRQTDGVGPSIVAVIRADLTYQDLRHALWDANFDDEGRDAVYVREGNVDYGDIESALTQNYSVLAYNLAENNRAFAGFRESFPPETQVANLFFKTRPRKSEPPMQSPLLNDLGPGAHGSSGSGFWTCGWSPTINNDWHDDVLCTNGPDQVRPYLLPNDSFVTQDEIMRAAAEYERQLNA